MIRFLPFFLSVVFILHNLLVLDATKIQKGKHQCALTIVMVTVFFISFVSFLFFYVLTLCMYFCDLHDVMQVVVFFFVFFFFSPFVQLT